MHGCWCASWALSLWAALALTLQGIISLCSRQGGFPQSSTVRNSEQNLCDFGLDVAGEGPSVPPAFGSDTTKYVAVGILWQVSHGLTIESVALPPESSWVQGAPEHILISVDFYRQKCLFLSGMIGYFGYFGGSKEKLALLIF